MYAFNCGNDSKNKLKAICKFQSKSIKIEQYKNYLDGCDYKKECHFYIIRSVSHDMYLQ